MSVIRPPGTEVNPNLEGGGELGGLDPQNLREAYKLPESGGSGRTVAIVDAYNDPNAQADLQEYRKQYKVYYKGSETACTETNGCFKKINQKGEAKNYPTNEPSWSVEISLDLDMVSASCPECHILLVEATSNSYANLGEAENEAASFKEGTTFTGTTVVSNSWGGSEHSGETSEDTSYYKHLGIPMTFSSGDYGYRMEYPAASKNVIAVGGTTLKKAKNTRGWSETVWSGTGSGCSSEEKEPSWQEPGSFPKSCGEHRTDNDIASDSSGESPMSVYDSYELPGWEVVWGTSAASPTIAAIEAQASEHTRSLGADAFYKKPGMLFDVTEGSNGSCPEHPDLCAGEVGYDGPTGWGTPDGVFEAPAGPVVTTGVASDVTDAAATLHGTVNPEGAETKYYFEYGLEGKGYEYRTPEVSVGSGTSAVEVNKQVIDLEPNSTYQFRVVAANVEGTSDGAEAKVTTPVSPRIYAGAFESGGPATYEFQLAAGVAINEKGDFWVLNNYVGLDEEKMLYEFNEKEEFIRAAVTEGMGSGELRRPTGIVVDAKGEVWVNDNGNSRTEIFNEKGEYQKTLAAHGNMVFWKGDVWIGGTAYNENAELVKEVKGMVSGPEAIDAKGDFWVATSTHLYEYNEKGEELKNVGSEGAGPGQFKEPRAVAIGTEGIWVSDEGNDRVEQFNERGEYVGQFGREGAGKNEFGGSKAGWPMAIAVDTKGNVYVTDNEWVEEWSLL